MKYKFCSCKFMSVHDNVQRFRSPCLQTSSSHQLLPQGTTWRLDVPRLTFGSPTWHFVQIHQCQGTTLPLCQGTKSCVGCARQQPVQCLPQRHFSVDETIFVFPVDKAGTPWSISSRTHRSGTVPVFSAFLSRYRSGWTLQGVQLMAHAAVRDDLESKAPSPLDRLTL